MSAAREVQHIFIPLTEQITNFSLPILEQVEPEMEKALETFLDINLVTEILHLERTNAGDAKVGKMGVSMTHQILHRSLISQNFPGKFWKGTVDTQIMYRNICHRTTSAITKRIEENLYMIT